MGLELELYLCYCCVSVESPSHTVGLEPNEFCRHYYIFHVSPSHTVGLELIFAYSHILIFAKVSIPHGGLRTDPKKESPRQGEKSPSHTVGLEPFSVDEYKYMVVCLHPTRWA